MCATTVYRQCEFWLVAIAEVRKKKKKKTK